MPVRRSSHLRYDEYTRRRREAAPDASASAAPSTTRKRSRSFVQLFGAFAALTRRHRPIIAATLVTLTASTVLGLIPPYGTKIVVDNVLGDHPLPPVLARLLGDEVSGQRLLTVIAVAVVCISLVSILLSLWGRWQATKTTKRVQAELRRNVFDHAVNLPLHRVYEMKSGGVTSMLREDAGGIGELIFSMVYNPWGAIIQLAGSLLVLAFVDWRLLLGSLLVIPCVFITHRTWISRIRPIYRDIRSTRSMIDAHATEAFGGMRVVRSFGRHRTESGRYTRNNHLHIRQELLAWRWARSVDMTWQFLIPAASAVLLWYGGTRILDDAALVRAGLLPAAQAITVGDLVMFLAYLMMLLGPLATLASTATQFQTNLAALDRVLDLLAEPTDMPDRPGAIVVSPRTTEGRLTIRDLSFHYPKSDRLVLEHVSFEANAGEVTALVGSSGAGKTTLCNLIARFYDPTGGAIELDGVDLRDITLDSYRRLLGVVEQDIFLFDGTIAHNISYASRDATREDVLRAAQLANVHEFVEPMEAGYDTVIGERGVRLSGGQRQRLAIARALLADPRILILDEATSNLDTHSERMIQASLGRLMAGRTTFVIAHRLSTIRHADRILVIEDGGIAEQGTHDELMARSGRYRRMVLMQLQPSDQADVDVVASESST
ncbi:MAG: ABC transporter ATP-binding protein [Phycisphaerales bacterium]|nr:ABC transporter ATP-binding protein [Phycisphaerales bacterium]